MPEFDDPVPGFLDLIGQGYAPPGMTNPGYDITPFGGQHPGTFSPGQFGGVPMGTLEALKARYAAQGKAKDMTAKTEGYSGVGQYTQPGNVVPHLIDPRQMQPIKPITIEDLYHMNATLRGMQSDRSASGARLAGVNDLMFADPVNLTGGIGFPRENPDLAWASMQGAASSAMERAKRDMLATNGPVFNVPIGMTNKGADFSHMPSQTALQMFNADRPPAQVIRDFNDIIRTSQGEGKKPVPGYPDFPGIENIGNQYFETAPGDLRKKFIGTMDTAPMVNAGMPQAGVARAAVTDPRFRGLIDPTTGRPMEMPVSTLVQFDPSRPFVKGIGHGTYDTGIPGWYGGNLEDIPAQVLFGNFMAGKNPSAIGRIIGTAPPKVTVDQQTVDRVNDWYMRAGRR